MGLTSPDGGPVPDDDPRLPTEAAVAALQDQADALAVELHRALKKDVDKPVTLEAKVDALESLLVPPGAAKVVFAYRVQERRLAILENVAKALRDKRTGPALVVARDAADIRLAAEGPG